MILLLSDTAVDLSTILVSRGLRSCEQGVAHHGILFIKLCYHQADNLLFTAYLIQAEFWDFPLFFKVRLHPRTFAYTPTSKMTVALAVWQVKTRFFMFLLLNIHTGA